MTQPNDLLACAKQNQCGRLSKHGCSWCGIGPNEIHKPICPNWDHTKCPCVRKRDSWGYPVKP